MWCLAIKTACFFNARSIDLCTHSIFTDSWYTIFFLLILWILKAKWVLVRSGWLLLFFHFKRGISFIYFTYFEWWFSNSIVRCQCSFIILNAFNELTKSKWNESKTVTCVLGSRWVRERTMVVMIIFDVDAMNDNQYVREPMNKIRNKKGIIRCGFLSFSYSLCARENACAGAPWCAIQYPFRNNFFLLQRNKSTLQWSLSRGMCARCITLHLFQVFRRCACLIIVFYLSLSLARQRLKVHK